MNKKALSLPLLISLVVGNMIGTGIYVLPSSLAQYGTLSIVSWLFTSLGALLLALTFANLNKRFPKTGGPYVFCTKAFGPLPGFLVAYLYWISNLVSIAGITVSSVSYLGFITPLFNSNSPDYQLNLVLCTELGLIWLFTIINIIGIHTVGVIQLFLTILKITPLILIIIVGFAHVHLDHLRLFSIDQPISLQAISASAALTFWAFIGLEAATIPAENTQGYRDIFKATVYGTLITSLIYILSTFVLMGMIPVTQLKNSPFPFAHAATLLFGSNGAFLIALCAVLSGLGALNVCILIQGQIVFAAARDHLFPKKFAVLTKHDVPIWGQILSSALVTLLLILTVQPSFLKQFDQIALLAALLTLATYLVTSCAEIKFIFLNAHTRKVLFNKSTYITSLAIIYSLWMISSLEWTTISIGILMVLCFIPVYFLTIKNKNEV